MSDAASAAVQAILDKIAEVREDQQTCRDRKQLPPLATMINSEIKLLEQLRDLQLRLAAAEPYNPAEHMTDEELIEGVCESIAHFPDAALDQIEAAIGRRRTGRMLRVVKAD